MFYRSEISSINAMLTMFLLFLKFFCCLYIIKTSLIIDLGICLRTGLGFLKLSVSYAAVVFHASCGSFWAVCSDL